MSWTQGTTEFMSMYVLRKLSPKHSPVHDLESIIWVLLWVIGKHALAKVPQGDRHNVMRKRIVSTLMRVFRRPEDILSASYENKAFYQPFKMS